MSPDNLGAALGRQARHVEAEAALRRALQINQAQWAGEPDHPEFAITLHRLGGTMAPLGRYDEAESLFERAVAIIEKALSADHPDMHAALNEYADALDAMGQPARAAALREQAEQTQ